MADESEWSRLESAVIKSLRHFRDRYLQSSRNDRENPELQETHIGETATGGNILESLPVSIIHIIIVSVTDIKTGCRGKTNRIKKQKCQ